MVGVDAISGGLTGFLLLLAVSAAAFAGLGLGASLWFGGRRRTASALLLPSLAVVIGVAWLLLQVSPSNIPILNLDLRQSELSALRAPPFRCSQNAGEEWCHVPQSVEALRLTLADGQQRQFKASSLHFVLNREGGRQLSFMPNRMKGPELLELIDTERTSGTPVPSSSSDLNDVRRAVEANVVLYSDERLAFQHGNQSVTLWILPRSSLKELYSLWYEVFSNESTALAE